MLLIRKHSGRLWKEEKRLTTYPRAYPVGFFLFEMAAVLEIKYVFSTVIQFQHIQPFYPGTAYWAH